MNALHISDKMELNLFKRDDKLGNPIDCVLVRDPKTGTESMHENITNSDMLEFYSYYVSNLPKSANLREVNVSKYVVASFFKALDKSGNETDYVMVFDYKNNISYVHTGVSYEDRETIIAAYTN